MGKTSVVLSAIKLLKAKGMLSKVLIVAPLRPCYLVWPAEVEKWLEFNDLKAEVLHGPGKEEAIHREADIYVMNPDGLEWLLGIGRGRAKPDMKRFKSFGFDTLVIDELTMFKNSRSLRFKLLKPLLGTFGRRWGLTGTPASNGLIDLFGQTYVLDMGNALGPYITHFKNEFFDAVGFGGYTLVPKLGAEDRIYEKLRPLTLRMAAEDFLELPELIQNTVFVELPARARRLYNELETEFMTMLDDKSVVTALNAGAKSTKCRQVACGGLYRQMTADGEPLRERDWEDLHDEKTKAVRELVDGNGGKPVLIAYEFHHDLARLQKEFPDAEVIGAGVSMAKCKAIERRWNAGEIQVLLGHPAAMGHGLNLQNSSNTVIWHSLTWNLELYQQFNERVLRQGNKHAHVTVHHVVAKDTVEMAVVFALTKKGATQDALLEALKAYRRR